MSFILQFKYLACENFYIFFYSLFLKKGIKEKKKQDKRKSSIALDIALLSTVIFD